MRRLLRPSLQTTAARRLGSRGGRGVFGVWLTGRAGAAGATSRAEGRGALVYRGGNARRVHAPLASLGDSRARTAAHGGHDLFTVVGRSKKEKSGWASLSIEIPSMRCPQLSRSRPPAQG